MLQHPTDHVNATYVLTGGEAIGFADLADALTEATGRHVDYVPISMEDAAQRYAKGVGEESIKAVLALAEYQRDGGKTAEVSPKVEEILGRPPRTVREFALDYRERFQSTEGVSIGRAGRSCRSVVTGDDPPICMARPLRPQPLRTPPPSYRV